MLNDKGFMCVMGQCLLQLGVDKKDMFNKIFPEDVSRYIKKPIKYLTVEKFEGRYKYYMNTELSNHAFFINDNSDINLVERERRLRALFKEHGHSIKFVGKSVDPKD